MKMGAASQRQQLATKKSLRIWVRNNGHMRRREKRLKYMYPRTVEAARDPFLCDTGKNKMFYLIAINLFPDSMIMKPDDSESEEEEVQMKNYEDCANARNGKTVAKRKYTKRPKKNDEGNNTDNMTSSAETVSSNGTIIGTTSNIKYKPSNKRAPPKRKNKGRRPRKKSVEAAAAAASVRHDLGNDIEFKMDESSPSTGGSGTDSTSSGSPSKDDYLVGASALTSPMEGDTAGEGGHAPSFYDALNNPLNEPQRAQSASPPTKKLSSSPPSGARSTPNIPSIAQSMQKVIRTCSETGQISFSLSKTPRQSRS